MDFNSGSLSGALAAFFYNREPPFSEAMHWLGLAEKLAKNPNWIQEHFPGA